MINTNTTTNTAATTTTTTTTNATPRGQIMNITEFAERMASAFKPVSTAFLDSQFLGVWSATPEVENRELWEPETVITDLCDEHEELCDLVLWAAAEIKRAGFVDDTWSYGEVLTLTLRTIPLDRHPHPGWDLYNYYIAEFDPKSKILPAGAITLLAFTVMVEVNHILWKKSGIPGDVAS